MVCAGMVGGGDVGGASIAPVEKTSADALVLGYHPAATVDWTRGAPDLGRGSICGMRKWDSLGK